MRAGPGERGGAGLSFINMLSRSGVSGVTLALPLPSALVCAGCGLAGWFSGALQWPQREVLILSLVGVLCIDPCCVTAYVSC